LDVGGSINSSTDVKIKNELDNLKLRYENIYIKYTQEQKKIEDQKNEIIDISYWGNKIKKMLAADLPDLDDNKPRTGLKYHVIDVQFQGTVKIEISNKIH
jgi:hypothetical protein